MSWLSALSDAIQCLLDAIRAAGELLTLFVRHCRLRCLDYANSTHDTTWSTGFDETQLGGTAHHAHGMPDNG